MLLVKPLENGKYESSLLIVGCRNAGFCAFCVLCSKVMDIHAVLEVTVFDEDPDKKAEFLGKVSIPLLQVLYGATSY